MGRHARPNIISAAEAAKQLGIEVHALYRYARNKQLVGVIGGVPLMFDRNALEVTAPPPGRPRLHEPESGRTQVTHSPSELKAWLKRAADDGYDSLAAWLRHLGNKRAGVA